MAAGAGAAIQVEVWDLPAAAFGSFLELVPAPLCIGRVELADGTWAPGFLCEPRALEGAEDVTALGGWRAWLARGS
jgi:allophanate hydrolase